MEKKAVDQKVKNWVIKRNNNQIVNICVVGFAQWLEDWMMW